MERKCIICGGPSISEGVGPTSNILIDCPTCDVKYEIIWIVYKTLKRIPLHKADGKKLLAHVKKEIEDGFWLHVIDLNEFKSILGVLPQDYE